ncbi:hypothetical protein A6A19_00240 [Actinobacillus delphinicola]|uniref:hypothetical protein n=1 Tax=Actinobacillus delphinicola TaxID=51161 RepID=UPI0024424BCC|nr:hypothetical protein [Actinobacillus delphinicola]MDG6896474.1 hypothetical protein [Actinobacillus delphinicola]
MTNKSDIQFSYNEFKKMLNSFITDNLKNDKIRVENIQNLQAFLNKDSKNFQIFSERFLDEGIKENTLPKNLINNPILKNSNKFVDALTKKLLDDTKKVMNSELSQAEKSKIQLKNYRQEQFKTIHKEIVDKQQNSQNQKLKQKNSLSMSM